MIVAFTSKGKGWGSMIDPRFGRTDYFLVYDESKDTLSAHDNRQIENEAHGAGPKTAQLLFKLEADVLITGNGPGGNAAAVLEKAGIKIFTGAQSFTVNEAYRAYQEEKLQEF
ncbi:MAG: NifB/NifX family molybdenum-iron cluster-binding protein [Bacteroidales bacterium]|nr:NifB/NifX family molybdenum-iron cluster-binding protein [Bacteroidales bacterium]MCF8344289.1 NifB/NifX family molybdenum-iron cluster-binding protein [Bacteroidales bacterium]MCF8351899.1 NifB/NifX family molybdenum-iron cluster-binding protein [Bacteroidales bacterium]MCF8377329.1 NifB/NifX family molybdenum-iron cluster-binding protein [Bacteroidales bacterium]